MHLNLVHCWDTAFSDKLWVLDLQHGPQMTEYWDRLVCAPFPLLSLAVLVFIKKENSCAGREKARRISMDTPLNYGVYSS